MNGALRQTDTTSRILQKGHLDKDWDDIIDEFEELPFDD